MFYYNGLVEFLQALKGVKTDKNSDEILSRISLGVNCVQSSVALYRVIVISTDLELRIIILSSVLK